MATRLKEHYQKEVRRKLQDEFGIKNPMAVPKVEKVVLNMGMGEAISNAKLLDTAVEELSTITGQKPVVTKANPGKNVKGGILERESPIKVDKLQVICPSCGEASRLGSHRNEEGEAIRYCRKCKADLTK